MDRICKKGRIIIELQQIPEDCYHCALVDDFGWCRYAEIFIDHRTKPGERYSCCPIDEVEEYPIPEASVLIVRPEWIPVSERLPSNSDCVLVQVNGTPDENIRLKNAFEIASYYDGGLWVIDAYPNWDNPEIVAWMDLPEPYTESEGTK